jgi:O-antigen/teichoic acid export membrane protein
MLRRFLKDSLIYSIPAFVSRGLSFFLIPLYTRVLSPAEYGSLDLFTVFVAIVNLAVAFEISQGVARFYSQEQRVDRKIRYASSAFWFTLICYGVFAVLMFLFADPMALIVMGQPNLENAFKIGIAYVWVNGLFYLIQNQFRWELRSKDYAVTSLLMSLVTAMASICFAYVFRWGLEGLLLGLLLGSLAGAALGLLKLRKSFCFCFDFARLREMLSFSVPLVFSGVAVWISLYIDRLMIKHFLSVDEVGLYGVGYRLASIAGLAMVGFQGALTPLVFAYQGKADAPQQLARIFRLFVAFALMMFLGISLFAKDILGILTDKSFHGAVVVVIYLVPAILLSNMYIFAPGVGIAKKNHYLIWTNVSGAALNALLNFLLIPVWGIAGAGLATLVGCLVTFLVQMTMSQHFYHVPHSWPPIAAGVLFSGAMAYYFSQNAFEGLERWGVNMIVLIIFVLIAVRLRLIYPGELRQAFKMMKKRLRLS